MTLILENLSPEPVCVAPPGIADIIAPRLEFALAPADGTLTSVGATLNGALLALGPGGALPDLSGKAVDAATPISLPPLGVVLVSFESDADACGR